MSEVCSYVQSVLNDIAEGRHSDPDIFCGDVLSLSRFTELSYKLIWIINIRDNVFFRGVKLKRYTSGYPADRGQEVELTWYEQRALLRAVDRVGETYKKQLKIKALQAREL